MAKHNVEYTPQLFKAVVADEVEKLAEVASGGLGEFFQGINVPRSLATIRRNIRLVRFFNKEAREPFLEENDFLDKSVQRAAAKVLVNLNIANTQAIFRDDPQGNSKVNWIESRKRSSAKKGVISTVERYRIAEGREPLPRGPLGLFREGQQSIEFSDRYKVGDGIGEKTQSDTPLRHLLRHADDTYVEGRTIREQIKTEAVQKAQNFLQSLTKLNERKDKQIKNSAVRASINAIVGTGVFIVGAIHAPVVLSALALGGTFIASINIIKNITEIIKDRSAQKLYMNKNAGYKMALQNVESKISNRLDLQINEAKSAIRIPTLLQRLAQRVDTTVASVKTKLFGKR